MTRAETDQLMERGEALQRSAEANNNEAQQRNEDSHRVLKDSARNLAHARRLYNKALWIALPSVALAAYIIYVLWTRSGQ